MSKTDTSNIQYKTTVDKKCMIQWKYPKCLKVKNRFISQTETKKGSFFYNINPAIAATFVALAT